LKKISGLVMGGRDVQGNVVGVVQVFTPGQTCNKSLAPMPVPSIDPVVTVIKGMCYMYNKS
jgi:hypothetical protein